MTKIFTLKISVLVACLLYLSGLVNAQVPLTQIVKLPDSSWQLRSKGQPYFIKGLLTGESDFKLYKELGANTARTYGFSAQATRQLLDSAQKYGIKVLVGFWINQNIETYNYPLQVNAIIAEIDKSVDLVKSHPAILGWCVGNEIDINAGGNTAQLTVDNLAKAVQLITLAIKTRDSAAHVVTTNITGNANTLNAFYKYAPSLDFISFNAYANLPKVDSIMKATCPNKPYLFTEWGTDYSRTTSWKALVYNNSAEQTEWLINKYKVCIAGNPYCLGSMAWFVKREAAFADWYVFNKDVYGNPYSTIDAIQFNYTGTFPAMRGPNMDSFNINGVVGTNNIRLQGGSNLAFTAAAHSLYAAGGFMNYKYKLEYSRPFYSSLNYSVPGYALDTLSSGTASSNIPAPAQPGFYRLFVTATDATGKVAYADIPFKVDSLPITGQPCNLPYIALYPNYGTTPNLAVKVGDSLKVRCQATSLCGIKSITANGAPMPCWSSSGTVNAYAKILIPAGTTPGNYTLQISAIDSQVPAQVNTITVPYVVTKSLTQNPTGSTSTQVKAYPNPITGGGNITLTNLGNSTLISDVELIDASGKTTPIPTQIAVSAGAALLPAGGLRGGIYQLRFYADNGTRQSVRVVVN